MSLMGKRHKKILLPAEFCLDCDGRHKCWEESDEGAEEEREEQPEGEDKARENKISPYKVPCRCGCGCGHTCSRMYGPYLAHVPGNTKEERAANREAFYQTEQGQKLWQERQANNEVRRIHMRQVHAEKGKEIA